MRACGCPYPTCSSQHSCVRHRCTARGRSAVGSAGGTTGTSSLRACRCYGFHSSFCRSWQLQLKNILYKSVLRKVNPHGEARCAADRDRNITLASAVPLSIRELSHPELHSAAIAGVAPCHSHNLPACFSSQISSFSLLSHNHDSAAQVTHLPVCPSVTLFPLMWGDSARDKGFGSLRWRAVVPLAVTKGRAYCAIHGEEHSMLRQNSPPWHTDTCRDSLIVLS